MKFEILWLVFLAAATQCRPWNRARLEATGNAKTCMEQNPMVKAIFANETDQYSMTPPSAEYFNYLECYFRKRNYLDDKDYINYTNMENGLSDILEDPEGAKRVVQPCKNIQEGSSAGERAYSAFKCTLVGLKRLHEEKKEIKHRGRPWKEEVTRNTNTCAEQSKMNKTILDDANREYIMVPPSAEYFNYLECYFRKQNFLDDKDYINYTYIENSMSNMLRDPERWKKMLQSCKNIQEGHSTGERAYNALKCILRCLKNPHEEEKQKGRVIPWRNITEETRNTCFEQTKSSKTTLVEAFKRAEILPPPSAEYFIYLECCYDKLNYLDAKGHVDYDNVENHIAYVLNDPEKAEEVVRPCRNLQDGSSTGERVYNAVKCMSVGLKKLHDEEMQMEHRVTLDQLAINIIP